jgi:hypothetical protein
MNRTLKKESTNIYKVLYEKYDRISEITISYIFESFSFPLAKKVGNSGKCYFVKWRKLDHLNNIYKIYKTNRSHVSWHSVFRWWNLFYTSVLFPRFSLLKSSEHNHVIKIYVNWYSI